MSPYEKIDCHSHFVPPEYTVALKEHGHANPDGMPGIPNWSEEDHLAMMSKLNVSKSMLSITSPGVHLQPGEDDFARNLAKYTNNFAADLKRRRPEQFGFFASLPIPDVEGSMAELHRVFDDLNADGIAMETNTHGVYIGDHSLDSIFDELNRRHATVFIHPTTPCMPDDHSIAVPVKLFPRSTYEFFFDTARAVINLFATGTVSRCPNITFIVPHLGGAFPPLINRFSRVAPILGLPGIDPSLTPEFVKERLNTQFYFDLAGWAMPEQLNGLLEYVTIERIVYGTDYPWTPLTGVVKLSSSFDEYLPKMFAKEKEQEAICRGNAKRLLSKEANEAWTK